MPKKHRSFLSSFVKSSYKILSSKSYWVRMPTSSSRSQINTWRRKCIGQHYKRKMRKSVYVIIAILFFHDATNVPEKKGGVGKTWLLRKCAKIVRERYENVAIAVVDFFSVGDRDSVEVALRIVKSLKEAHSEWSR